MQHFAFTLDYKLRILPSVLFPPSVSLCFFCPASSFKLTICFFPTLFNFWFYFLRLLLSFSLLTPSRLSNETLKGLCARGVKIPHFASRCGWLLPTMTLSLLTIFWFGWMALFLFQLAKEAPTSLLIVLFVTLGLPFPIRQAQCVETFLRRSASSPLVSAGPSRLPLLLPSSLFRILLCSCYVFLSSMLFYISHFLAYLAGTVISLLVFCYYSPLYTRSLIFSGR